MITHGAYVRLEKQNPVDESNCPTPDSGAHVYGAINDGQSLPNKYWVAGILAMDIKEGRSVIIDRQYRNGVEAEGVLQTSTIKTVTELPDGKVRLETLNSVYIMEQLEQVVAKGFSLNDNF